LTTVRRGWRSGLDLALFVSTLVLIVGFSLLTNVAPSGPFAPIGRWSALHMLNAVDAAGASQLNSTGGGASSNDAPDEDDDSDDGDEVSALLAVASPAPRIDCAVSWLPFRPAFEPLSSRASDNHSLRAPPQ
jgi:hypothetical protein